MTREPLTLGELRALLREHGSWEAVVTVRPELASALPADVVRRLTAAATVALPPPAALRGIAETIEKNAVEDAARLDLVLELVEAQRRRQAEEDELRALQLAEARGRGSPEAPEEGTDERAERWRIPTASFWYILEQRLKRGKAAGAYTLSEEMRRTRRIAFVGRTRTARLVAWIDAHPEQAQRAWVLHETPAGFRASKRGVLVPKGPKPS